MSGPPPQLPPRSPIQRKTPLRRPVPVSGNSCGHSGSGFRSTSEGQPEWLNDLLHDMDSDCDKETGYRCNDRGSDDLGGGRGGSYGPNSPRSRIELGFSEKEIVSNLQNSLRNPSTAGGGYDDDDDDFASENKGMKRSHPGQRSRARKLQYIAALEKTVVLLQDAGLQLAFRAASLARKHAALRIENDSLKLELVRMMKEKFILDGEYQSLKKEMERARAGFVICSESDAGFDILNIRKLDLN